MSERQGLESRTTKWMVAGIVLTVLAVLAFPLYRINEPAARAAAAEQAEANLARTGADIWAASCASCHGVAGEGVDAPALNSLQFLTIVSDEQMASIIATGMPGTDMVAYSQQFDGPLTREQIAGLVACVRSWEEDAPDRPDWRDMLNVVEEEGDGHGHGPEPEDDHGDEVGEEGPAPCGPDYDAANFVVEDDHADDEPAEEAADDHEDPPGTPPHDDEPAEEAADDHEDPPGTPPHDDEPAEEPDHVDPPGTPPHDDEPAEEPDHVDPPGTPDHDD